MARESTEARVAYGAKGQRLGTRHWLLLSQKAAATREGHGHVLVAPASRAAPGWPPACRASRALLPPAEMLVKDGKRGPACAAGLGGMEQSDRPSEGGVRVPRLRERRRPRFRLAVVVATGWWAYRPSKTANAASILEWSPVALSSSMRPRMTARARVAWAWAVTSSGLDGLSSSVNWGSQSWTLERPKPGNRSGWV